VFLLVIRRAFFCLFCSRLAFDVPALDLASWRPVTEAPTAFFLANLVQKGLLNGLKKLNFMLYPPPLNKISYGVNGLILQGARRAADTPPRLSDRALPRLDLHRGARLTHE